MPLDYSRRRAPLAQRTSLPDRITPHVTPPVDGTEETEAKDWWEKEYETLRFDRETTKILNRAYIVRPFYRDEVQADYELVSCTFLPPSEPDPEEKRMDDLLPANSNVPAANEPATTSNATPATVRTAEPAAYVKFTNFGTQIKLPIPASLYSAEAAQWIALSKGAAWEAWTRWCAEARETKYKWTLSQCIMIGIERRLPAGYQSDTLARDLVRAGLREELADVFADPKHKRVFELQSMTHWLCDTIGFNFNALHTIRTRLIRHSQAIGPDQPQGILPLVKSDFGLSGSVRVVQDFPPVREAEYIQLWSLRTPCIYGKPCSLFVADGTLNPEVLLDPMSSWRGDFESRGEREKGMYFTRSREIAEEFRAFQAQRCPNGETQLVRIDVPKSWLEKKGCYALDWSPTDVFKYAWECGNEGAFVDILPGLFLAGRAREMERVSSLSELEAMGDAEAWVNEKSGEMEQQWVFGSKRIQRELVQVVRGKVYVEIFAPLSWSTTCAARS